MKFYKILIVIFLLFAIVFGTFAAADENRKITVAVVDFTDHTGKRLRNIDQVSTEILSTLLHNTGNFIVVERAKLQSIITEQGFTMSGLVDSTKNAVQVGKLLGADFLITGSILTYGEKTVTFKGYGISTEKILTELNLNLKILDVNTGNIEYASLLSAQDEVLNTDNNTTKSDLNERVLLKKALESGVKEITVQIEAKKRSIPEKVNVQFFSTPEGADVEIGNVFYGNTPITLKLNPGLHQVRISHANYEPWEKTINAYEGLEVKAVLEKKQEEKKVKIEINDGSN